MKKYILDVDTGIDDALAIAYLVSRKDIEVLGITTGFGNVTADNAYHNTINVLHMMGRDDIPVYRGSDHPLGTESFTVHPISYVIHGNNGIGNVELENFAVAEKEMNASEFMVDCARKYQSDLIIITVGALTNIVKAIDMDKKAIEGVGNIVVMGGALTVKGNCNNYAEANILRDPVAAHQFYQHHIQSTMVGLDVTLRTIITENELMDWAQYDNTAAKALIDMARYYYTNEGDSAQAMAGCLHDPLAVEVAINPDIISHYYDCDIVIEDKGESLGRTVLDDELLLNGPRKTRVCLEVKASEFVERFVKVIGERLKTL